MDKRNRFGWMIGLLALLLSGGLALQTVQAQDEPPSVTAEEPLRTVSVGGTGRVNATPDAAVARLGVRTEADTAQEALSQNNQNMETLLDSLRTAGIADEDIQTQFIQLQPRYADPQEPQAGTPDLTGYTAANIVEVRIRDLDNVGQIIDDAIQAGGNTIEGIFFEVTDPSAVEEQAREEAINDAREKAGQIAALVNAELGEIISVTEGVSTPFPFGSGGAVALESAPIEPGVQTVFVQVQVTWRLVSTSAVVPSTGGTRTPTEGVASTRTTTATARPAATRTPAATESPAATASPATTESPAGTGTAAAPGAEPEDLDGLVNALRDAGARVELASEIQQPFFPVEGRIIRVSGEEVQVFEFQDEAERQSVSDTISETGDMIGNSIPSWVEQPTIWAQGRLIALYVGVDQDLIDMLNDALGEPVASAGEP